MRLPVVLHLVLLLCFLAFAKCPSEAHRGNSSARFQEPTPQQSQQLAEADRLSDSAVRLLESGKYAEAVTSLKRALEIRERVLGPGHSLVASTLATLGEGYMGSDRQDEARKVLQRSLAIFESRQNPDDLQLCTVLEELANLSFTKHDYAKAESLLQRSQAIKEKILGAEDLQVATALNRLARVFQMEKKYDDAETLYVRAIGIREGKLGRSHPDTVATMKGYACLNIAMIRITSEKPSPEPPPKPDETALRERAGCWLAGFQDDCGSEPAKRIESLGILNGRATRLAPIHHSAEARQQRAAQLVFVAVLVDEKGDVIKAKAVCGTYPSLASTSEAAALASKFPPTLRDGKPIKVSGILIHNYIAY